MSDETTVEEYGTSKLPIAFDQYIDCDIIEYGKILLEIEYDGATYTPFTNVPHSCSLHERADFHWGYLGPAPMNLALNILEYVLEENPDWKSGYRKEVRYGTCDEVAFYLFNKFCKEMLSDLPAFKGCHIRYSEVEEWLVKNMAL